MRIQYEFTAMSSLMAMVDGQLGERFEGVRIFEMLADPHALIMEKRPEVDCRRLLALAVTDPGSGAVRAQVLTAMHNTGALLRRFHGLPELPHTKSRCAEVGELIDSQLRLTQYLRKRVRQGPLLDRISRELVKASRTSHSDGLPLGLSHGDLLPGNVLVGRHGRVVLLDTLAEWRAPVYEDLGQFLVGLRLFMLRQMPTKFDATFRIVERWEQEFLAGYFADEPIPLGWIRIFECQFLLERWAWLVHEALEEQGFRLVAKKCGLSVWLWFAQRLFDRLLCEANHHGVREKAL
ncbi:MAG: phosphotransferase [Ilumatobacteraceae bacterium]